MGMIVQHNMNALNAYNALNANVSGLKKSSEKLSSGYRINRAGDDAAGLAISEKMRSQIRGLNQAVRNSQDGINMVQTFEGAAQETHSILQRMKELATESANGTYDNATDRAAIQLEFDQLNDELNQIADTDFNGTIVLNGGVMADGTVAQNGEFNYANNYTELAVANEATDISGKQGHTIVDQTFYDKAKADAVYDALGVDDKSKTVNVTFMFDGERWVADTVTDAATDEVIEGARAAGLTAKPVDRTDASGKGGFEVIAGKDENGEDIVATNAIFNEMTPVKKGDTVTIQFQNTAAKTYAPKNAGIDEETYTVTKGNGATDHLSKTDTAGKLHFELDKGLTDAVMNDEVKGALDELDATNFKITYAGGVPTIAVDGAAPTKFDFDATTGEITSKGGVKLGKLSADNITTDTPATKASAAVDQATGTAALKTSTIADFTKLETKIKDADATKVGDDKADVTVTVTWNNTNSNWDLTGGITQAGVSTADLENTYGIKASQEGTAAGQMFNVIYQNSTSAKTGVDDTTANGEVKFGVNIDAYNVVDLNTITVHAVATPEIATMKSQVTESGVTVANAFKNSTARMTYTDNITLQTGARTKDAVNFNFSYNTDGTADMGNLLANLDLSARSTGLNTANLSLANADDANYAIDQIDKAINKTSMVRATFGSIQNRLEHKITNLTTTAENLTEAESSIRDTDMASEMMNYTKYNILQQAAQSMLAQANQQPQSILQLLG